MPNDAESVLATCRTMRELDPGACDFSVDSAVWSTPVADMPFSSERWISAS